jgi:hypothetical protein
MQYIIYGTALDTTSVDTETGGHTSSAPDLNGGLSSTWLDGTTACGVASAFAAAGSPPGAASVVNFACRAAECHSPSSVIVDRTAVVPWLTTRTLTVLPSALAAATTSRLPSTPVTLTCNACGWAAAAII